MVDSHIVCAAAIRGRDRGGDCIQVLEPHCGDFTNTITSVQKDNVLIMTPNKEGLKIAIPETTAKYRIRKLTSLECWRLMGFEDEDFYRAQAAMNENLYGGKDRSGTQLYKQAGNSIVVDVLLHIFENLYDAMPYLFEDIQIGSFFSGIGAFEKALSMLLENGDRDVLSSEGKSDIIGVVDPQGRMNKKCRINEVCPTLRAQTHGNPPCVVHDQLEQIGYINNYNGDANRIYDCSVARALKAEAGGGGRKDRMVSIPSVSEFT